MPIIDPKNDLVLLFDKDANAAAEAKIVELFKAALAAGSGISLTENPANGKLTIGGGSGMSFTAAETAPASPLPGDFWLDVNTRIVYQRQQNGGGAIWLDIGNAGTGATPTGTITFPASPVNGQAFVTPAGRSYTYSTAKGAWNASPPVSGGSGGSGNVIVHYGAGSGTATAVVATCAPVITTLTVGAIVAFTAPVALDLSVATTFSPNGLTAAPLRNRSGAAAGSALAGDLLLAIFDGGNWRVIAGLVQQTTLVNTQPAGQWLRVADFTFSGQSLVNTNTGSVFIPAGGLLNIGNGATLPAGFTYTGYLQVVWENITRTGGANFPSSSYSALRVYPGNDMTAADSNYEAFWFNTSAGGRPTRYRDASGNNPDAGAPGSVNIGAGSVPSSDVHKFIPLLNGWANPVPALAGVIPAHNAKALPSVINVASLGTVNGIQGKVRVYALLHAVGSNAQTYGET